MKPINPPPELTSRPYRWVTAALGLLFLGLAVAILFTAGRGNRAGAIGAALGVGGLGLDAVVSTVRQRRSLLSRLGPWP